MKTKTVIKYINQEIKLLKNRLGDIKYEIDIASRKRKEGKGIIKRIKNKIKILDASIKILEIKNENI